MKLLLPLALAAALVGCSTTPIPAEQAKAVPAERLFAFQQPLAGSHATFQITRDTGSNGSWCDTEVLYQGKPVAKLAAGETARLYLPAGEGILGARMDCVGEAHKERQLTLQPGRTYRYRISYSSSKELDISPTAY